MGNNASKTAALSLNDMFEAARSLVAGAKIILDSNGIRVHGYEQKPTLPVIVCCALAIEIGLKTLLTLVWKGFPRKNGHSLITLFAALPESTQAELLSFQQRFTGRTAVDAKRQLFLEDMTFVKWRYAYENEYLATSPAFLHDFGVALSEFTKTRLGAQSVLHSIDA